MVRLLYSIHSVESSLSLHPPPGDNGTAIGPFQIRPCVIEDLQSWNLPYTLDDRNDLRKSVHIFILYTTHYAGVSATDEARARTWNGGPDGPTEECTLPYWARVQEAMLTYPYPPE